MTSPRPWKQSELEGLRRKAAAGTSLRLIALAHHRPQAAIQSKLDELGVVIDAPVIPERKCMNHASFESPCSNTIRSKDAGMCLPCQARARRMS